MIDDLDAVHDVTLVKGIEQRSPDLVAEIKRLNPPIVHPVVKVHPETGRKVLFVSQRIRNFVGLTEDESEPLCQGGSVVDAAGPGSAGFAGS